MLAPGTEVTVTLSGGGSRLYAHLGVLAACEDAGLVVKEILGVSGGAVAGAAYAALGFDAALALVKRFDFSRAMRWGWLQRFGLFDNRELRTAAEEAGITWKACRERGVAVSVGVTALEPGLPVVWHEQAAPFTLAEAVRISASIPCIWSYTRVPASQIRLTGLPPEAKVPKELTLVDGGVACLMLPGSNRPWIASNVAFNGYRDSVITGFIDYLAQNLAVMQYRLMQRAITGAAVSVSHRNLRAAEWLASYTPEQIEGIVMAARIEAASAIEEARRGA